MDQPGRLKAGHHGHIYVHRNQIKRHGFNGLDSLDAVAGNIGTMSDFLQRPGSQQLIYMSVLHDQNFQPGHGVNFMLRQGQRRGMIR